MFRFKRSEKFNKRKFNSGNPRINNGGKRQRRCSLQEESEEEVDEEEVVAMGNLLNRLGCNGANYTVTDDDNHIYFNGPVTHRSMDKLVEVIKTKNDEMEDYKRDKNIYSLKPNPLYLHINSPGGALFAVIKAIDAIKESKIPVYTIIDGYAASCGSLLSVIGKRRYMTPTSLSLIHQLSSGMGGKYSEIEDDYENCKQWMDTIIDLYEEYTDMDREEIESALKHDLWWKVDTCIEKGLVDEVWDRKAMEKDPYSHCMGHAEQKEQDDSDSEYQLEGH